jgi:hypothetical protein
MNTCSTCKHRSVDVFEMPCSVCLRNNGGNDMWEPMDPKPTIPQSKFWVVMKDRLCLMCSIRHDTRESALKEAERLTHLEKCNFLVAEITDQFIYRSCSERVVL